MATYYVKNGGNDSLNGLSDANAWNTLARASQAPLTGGDTVLFKRGSRWREEVTFFTKGGTGPNNRLVYGAYDVGTQPIIDGSDIHSGWISEASGGATIYYKSFGSMPGAIFSDGNPLRLVADKAGLVPGREWWDATNLRQYIRLHGDDNPSGHTVEVATRVYPLRIQGSVNATGADHWTVQDLWIRGAKKANFFVDTCQDTIVERCTFSHASENGLHYHTWTNLSTDGFIIQNCVAYNNGACGITCAGNFATSMSGIRIRNNETYSNCWQPVQKESGVQAYTAGIRPIGREINDIIVEDNYVHDEGMTFDSDFSHGCGIWFDTTGEGSVCRRNRIERTTSWGVQIEDVNNARVHSNLIVGSIHVCALGIIRNCDNNQMYNNTVVNCWGGINLANFSGSHFNGNQLYNNVVTGSTNRLLLVEGGVTSATQALFNRNVFGPASANFIYWNANISTFAAWESAMGVSAGASNTIQQNPTFVNAAGGDYHLAANSVGRSAGAPIPAGTLDFTKAAFNASAPTVGAYEITTGPATAMATAAVRSLVASTINDNAVGDITPAEVRAAYTGMFNAIDAADVGQARGEIAAPTNRTYVVDLAARYDYRIMALVTQAAAGTATVAVQVNGTNVTGLSAIAVGTTPTSAAATAANTVTAGQRVTLVVTGASGITELAYALHFTRT